jgi:hypothetical protein
MSLHRKYVICREIVILLGMFEYISLGLGIYNTGAKDYTVSVVWFCLMVLSYYISSKLGYKVLEWLVRMEKDDATKERS